MKMILDWLDGSVSVGGKGSISPDSSLRVEKKANLSQNLMNIDYDIAAKELSYLSLLTIQSINFLF